MNPETNNASGNSTMNTVLIIILVIIVGLVVWYFTSHKSAQAPDNLNNSSGGLHIDIGGSSNTSNSAPANNSGY